VFSCKVACDVTGHYKPKKRPEGHCPQRWALPTKMGIAHKDGHCPQRWALPTKMGIAHKNGHCLSNKTNKEILYKYPAFRNVGVVVEART